jgi:predicted amidohydrolase YtcJ
MFADLYRTRWQFVAGAVLCAVLGSAKIGLASEPADTVFRNGVVYTVNTKDELAEAVAVRAGKIVAVGTSASMDTWIGKTTKVIDLGGKVLMPGLIDAHMHPLGGGGQLTSCNLNYEALSVDQILARITQCLQEESDAPPEHWLEVRGWYRQAMTPPGADLAAEILDRLPTKRPVIVVATDFHSMAASSKAMQEAGITSATADPAGGKIDRKADGSPSGIFLDAAMWQVSAAAPPLPADVQAKQSLRNAEAALALINSQGVTTIFDAAASEDSIAAFDTLRKQGKLTVRGEFAPVISAEEAADPGDAIARIKALSEAYSMPRDSVDGLISVRTAKVFMDGVIQAPAQTGALLEPYLHNTGSEAHPHWTPSENRGQLYVSEAQLAGVVRDLAAADLNMHLHTDGDHAVHVALNAIEQVTKAGVPLNIRLALAHNELVEPADYPRFKALNALPILSFQWGKPAPDTLDSVKNYIGEDRFRYLETSGKFHAAGARIAFGSDWPIDPLNEWFAMKVAITRTNAPDVDDRFKGRLGDDPGLDINTAIRAFTINAAYSLRLDDVTGSIEVGKMADLIVIDRNLLKIPAEQVAETKVLFTMLGGKQVYSTGNTRTD